MNIVSMWQAGLSANGLLVYTKVEWVEDQMFRDSRCRIYMFYNTSDDVTEKKSGFPWGFVFTSTIHHYGLGDNCKSITRAAL